MVKAPKRKATRSRPRAIAPKRAAKPASSVGARFGGIADAAVLKATGEGWAHWLKVLDGFDVKTNGHAAAAEHLHSTCGVGPWWSQMVVVGYEQARGLRVKYQTAAGFSVSASRTLECSAMRAFAAWQEPERSGWLADPGFTTRKQTPGKSMRITWVDGKSNVEVMFYPKGPAKCSVSVQHNKLASSAAASKLKRYWGEQMDALRHHVGAS